jgi:SAM-dependent methyltransferase
MPSAVASKQTAHRTDHPHGLPGGHALNFERTLNRTGVTIHTLDEISEAFVSAASAAAPHPVVDIGAGFGVATLAALNAGATVISNDIEPEHLAALQSRTPAEQQPRLTLMPGRFPDDVQLNAGSVSAVLLSRVLHFFDGPQVLRSIETLYRWLVSGGRAFVVCDASLFLMQPPLRAAYEAQLAAGQEWPGFVRGVHQLLPERAGQIPDQLHYLDPDTLARAFERAGFAIERAELFVRDCGEQGPPRRCTGVIARKQ